MSRSKKELNDHMIAIAEGIQMKVDTGAVVLILATCQSLERLQKDKKEEERTERDRRTAERRENEDRRNDERRKAVKEVTFKNKKVYVDGKRTGTIHTEHKGCCYVPWKQLTSGPLFSTIEECKKALEESLPDNADVWGPFSPPFQPEKRYCFDIDGTICTQTEDTYENAKPIQKMIDKINKLYFEGHHIIIHTARGQESGVDREEFTKKQLADWGLKYHDFHIKPSADYYIDDRSVSIKDFMRDRY